MRMSLLTEAVTAGVEGNTNEAVITDEAVSTVEDVFPDTADEVLRN